MKTPIVKILIKKNRKITLKYQNVTIISIIRFNSNFEAASKSIMKDNIFTAKGKKEKVVLNFTYEKKIKKN